MTSYNRVILVGNLTRDPQLSYTPAGKSVCNFDLAMNHSFKDSSGEKRDQATFVPITVWGKQAELTAEYLKKGRQCLVEGALRQEKWVDKTDQKRSRLKVIANNIRFLGQAPKTEQKQPEPVEEEEQDSSAPSQSKTTGSPEPTKSASQGTRLEHGEDIPF